MMSSTKDENEPKRKQQENEGGVGNHERLKFTVSEKIDASLPRNLIRMGNRRMTVCNLIYGSG